MDPISQWILSAGLVLLAVWAMFAFGRYIGPAMQFLLQPVVLIAILCVVAIFSTWRFAGVHWLIIAAAAVAALALIYFFVWLFFYRKRPSATHPADPAHPKEEHPKKEEHDKSHDSHGHSSKGGFFASLFKTVWGLTWRAGTLLALVLVVVWVWENPNIIAHSSKQPKSNSVETADVCEEWMHENIHLTRALQMPAGGSKCRMSWDVEPGYGPVTLIADDGSSHTYPSGTNTNYEVKYWQAAGSETYVRAAFCPREPVPKHWDDNKKRCV